MVTDQKVAQQFGQLLLSFLKDKGIERTIEDLE